FASRIEVVERIDEVADAARKILLQIRGIIEVDDERLILGIALPNERQCRTVHALPFIPHAAAVVDDQAEADWNILVPERLDRLLHFVFENLEMLLFQAVNGSALFVENRDRQLYFE